MPKSKRKQLMTVILPAYNLEKEIFDIVIRTKKFSDTVIVITDGSNDNTLIKAREAKAIVPPQRNVRGKGNAIRRGIKVSKNYLSNVIIFMDADGQHLPEEIPKITKPIINEGYDFVIGSRIKGKFNTSPINKFGNYCLRIISFLVTFRWVSDTETGFRAFKTKKLYSLSLFSERFEIEGELLLKSLKKGFLFKEIPITVPKAVKGVTVRDGIRMGLYKIKIALNRY